MLTFQSPHFDFQPLAEGVFGAIARDGGAGIANAGLVDLGGLCLAYDTGLTPSAGADLLRAARELTGRSPDLVISSHYHNDHIWGNQAFVPGARFIASRLTRQLILSEGQLELEDARAHAADKLAAFQARHQNAQNEAERTAAAMWLGYYGGLVADLPRLAVTLPEILFEEQLSLQGSRRSARLIAYPGGHTGSDAVLYLPEDGLVLMSDLLFVNFHPYLGDGDPQLLLQALRAVLQLPAERYLPGHGPLGTRCDLELIIAYVEDCLASARTLAAAGPLDPQAIRALPIPAPYQAWQLPMFYYANLQSLAARFSAATA